MSTDSVADREHVDLHRSSRADTTAEREKTRRRGRAGLLVCAGLLIQAPTLFEAHPVAFLTFALVGGTLVLAGVGYYVAAELLSE